MDGWVGVYVVGGMGGWKDAGIDIIDYRLWMDG